MCHLVLLPIFVFSDVGNDVVVAAVDDDDDDDQDSSVWSDGDILSQFSLNSDGEFVNKV